jgi:hypothetical protein
MQVTYDKPIAKDIWARREIGARQELDKAGNGTSTTLRENQAKSRTKKSAARPVKSVIPKNCDRRGRKVETPVT